MSRKKRILKALGIDDEVDALFGVKPRTRAQRRVPSQNPLAVQLNRAAQQPRRALPAPPKQLALPPPDPSKQLPPFAAKPRGGQWWADRKFADVNSSPDAVARGQAEASRFAGFTPALADDFGIDTSTTTEQDWLAKALARYYKTEFGSPTDPLRDLAARNLHYDPDMTPERWSGIVNSHLQEDEIGQVLFPYNRQGGMPGAGDDLRGQAMSAMPWLAKVPVTDKIYGIGGGGLDIGHFEDELYNALNPEMSGIPADLALRPESLARMSFPQAVERVGRINQFRAKQMEEQAASALNNPAIQTFKEYPEAGYRWVELRAPDLGDELPEGFDIRELDMGDGTKRWAAMDMRTPDAEGRPLEIDVLNDPEAARKAIAGTYGRQPLADALKFEGDTMGHCVGGYCDDVMSGRSRIFSLRDPKGQPHVTIEAAPTKQGLAFEQMQDFKTQAEREAQDMDFADDDEYFDYIADRREQIKADWLANRAASAPQDIVQIKGKQNRAPTDDYLPYVQDFVKSGTWGNIGDLQNTGLAKLPDGRYITQQQMAEGMARARAELPPEADPSSMITFNWNGLSPFFEGYAVGGRVDRNRCFSRHPMSVR